MRIQLRATPVMAAIRCGRCKVLEACVIVCQGLAITRPALPADHRCAGMPSLE
jgi:hypothetical protein